MWRKIGILGFSLLIGLLVLVSGGQLKASASDVTSSMTGVDGPSAIELSASGDGNDWKTMPSNSSLESGESYYLHYNWTIKDGVTINKGDTATVTLPTGSTPNIASPLAIQDLSTNEEIGWLVVDKGGKDGAAAKAHIEFTKDLKENHNRHGTVSFYSGGTAENTTSGSTVISKNGWVQESRGSNGIPTQMTWDIDFNSLHQDLGKVTLTDTLGEFQTYDPAKDKITILQVTGPDGTQESDTDAAKYMPKVSVDSSGKVITFEFPNIDSKEITIWYTSTVANSLSGSGGALNNGVSMVSTNPTTGDEGTGNGTGAADNPAKVIKNSFWGGFGDYQGDYRRTIVLTKTGVNGIPLKGATYTLTSSNGTEYQGTTDDNGQIFWANMIPGNYTYVENSAPTGYAVDPTPYKAIITENDGPDDLRVSASDKLESSSSSSSSSSTNSSSNSSSSGNSSGGSSSNESTNSSNSNSSGSTSTSETSDKTSDSSGSSSKTSSTKTSSTKTSSSSTSTTKTKHGIVAATGSNSSSATPSSRHGGNAAGTTANGASQAAKRQTNPNSYLPRTSGQRSALAMLIGFLILGLSVAGWRWRQTHTTH